MKRLTELVGDSWIARQERINGKYPTDRDVYNKLAEYEDIGLTPEEIKYFLKDFGITITMRNRELIKELQEYRSLKADGKLVKLPCKVGDVVYEANINRNIISIYRITSIVVMSESRNYNWGLISGIYSNINGFNEFALGKTIFLTREDAEKALKESVLRMETNNGME